MKRILMILLGFELSGCTVSISVKPIPVQPKNRPHHAQTYNHKPKQKTTLVDSDWIENYKREEQAHSYTIPDDSKIKSVGDKFSVPQSVVDHYNDFTRVKSPPSPSPLPPLP